MKWIQCDVPSFEKWYHLKCVDIERSVPSNQLEYLIFNCPFHKQSEMKYRQRFVLGESPLESKATSTTLEDCTASVASSKPKVDCAERPNNVGYGGNIYHISRFLSLHLTKSHAPWHREVKDGNRQT